MSQPKQSSYKKKKPFVYSETYKHWRDEARKNGSCSEKARMLACAHAKQFRVEREGCQ